MQRSYTITLDDADVIALEAAIKFYIAHCRAQMPDGNAKCPYWAHLRTLEAIKLFEGHRLPQKESAL